MIDLTLSNGSVFVWNVDGNYNVLFCLILCLILYILLFADVYKLRKDHRIVGYTIGCLASLPRQDQLLGVPMQLTREEVNFLLSNKLARLMKYRELDGPVGCQAAREKEEVIQKSYLEQSVLYKEERLNQLMKISNQIIAGKKKKYGSDNFDENAALQEEIDKIPQMPEDVMMVQLLTRKTNVHSL